MASNTYVALATTTVSTPVSSVTFSSIPQGYTDLVIVCNYASSNGLSFLYGIFNSDTGAHYSLTDLYANGYGVSSVRATNISINWLAYNVGCNSTVGDTVTTINLMNYSNTTNYKTYISETRRAYTTGSAGYHGIDNQVGLWRGSTGSSTEAITSVTFKNNTSGVDYNFAAGSTFTMYGISNADSFNKANGGVIVEDGTNLYHIFGATGSFTPKQNLTANILTIAGGGGGWAGAGGAGGHVQSLSQSLTSGTSYTVTVGAGGPQQTTGGQGGNSNVTGGSLSLTAAVGGGYGGGGSGMAGGNGGSGGGGGWGYGSGGSGTSGQGFAGGAGSGPGGGAGGGATSAGTSGPDGYRAGTGTSAYSAIAQATNLGEYYSGSYYFCGGGGYSANNTPYGGGNGGVGGGGGHLSGVSKGMPNTGGGGTGDNAGGSGVVIIWYTK
jgi:hypothetical protein